MSKECLDTLVRVVLAGICRAWINPQLRKQRCRGCAQHPRDLIITSRGWPVTEGVAVIFAPGYCGIKKADDEERARLPEFLSELDLASLEASEEDVEALRKVVKRLAPEKNGEYQVYQVFFGNEDLLKEWLKGAGVVGQPGVDFPVLTSIPPTSFSCRELKGGYYADLETSCQVFHICDNGRKISFLCPNGTIFQQSQLICDWWFKVDCSKSTELYEQSAEQLAEEERKRAEAKRMNSEFHRSSDKDDTLDYDGRQNGRMNPYGQPALQNQLQGNQQKSNQYPGRSQQSKPRQNQFVQSNSLSGSDRSNQPSDTFNQKQGFPFNDYRSKTKTNQDNRSIQSSNGQDHRVIENEKSLGPPKSRSRNDFSSSIQKVTPVYTESTTFRTSTSNPVKEYQQPAESVAFAANRNNRYNKAYSSNQFNNIYPSQAPGTENFRQDSSTTHSSKEAPGPPLFRSRVPIPNFPLPTYAPIYKPRTSSSQRVEEAARTTTQRTTTSRTYVNTDAYRQNGATTQATYGSGFETTTITPFATPEYQANTEISNSYSNVESYPRNSPTPGAYGVPQNQTTSGQYPTEGYQRNTVTARPYYQEVNIDQRTEAYPTTSYENTEGYRDAYGGGVPERTDGNFPGNVARGPTSAYHGQASSFGAQEADSPLKDDQEREGAFSTRSPFRTSQNSIGVATEKPYRNAGRTLSPYDTSFTYRQGKVTSTQGPYVPFTRNYAFGSTSTTPRSIANPGTTSTYDSGGSDLKSTLKNTLTRGNVPSSTARVRGSATYLPKGNSGIGRTPGFEGRPPPEREHAISMLQSLQGLEGTVPALGDYVNGSRSGLNIPTSSGPSALHSLALYFATASEEANSTETLNESASGANVAPEGEISKKSDASAELPVNILTQHTVNSYVDLFNLNNVLETNATEKDPEEGDDTSEDLDLQQSEGPLNGGRKSNNTKLRELAQVFTHALSAYLQDPDTFKKVLTEIRPTEPSATSDNDIWDVTTEYPTTSEEYPSVTKEKDEVLDFSDVTKVSWRKKPTSTYPSTTQPSAESTFHTYYTSPPDYFTTISVATSESRYPPVAPTSSSLSRNGFIDSQEQPQGNNVAFEVNQAFGSSRGSDVENYQGGSVGSSFSDYFPIGSVQNGTTSEPYGKRVKPFDATPINNYVASSTPASFQADGGVEGIRRVATGRISEKLTPPLFGKYMNTATTDSFDDDKYNSVAASFGNVRTTPVFQKNDSSQFTKPPFRINYYGPSDSEPVKESLVTASSLRPTYNSRNNLEKDSRTTPRSTREPTYSDRQTNDHWTSSPVLSQLWETTVFVDPNHINRGLVDNPAVTQPTVFESTSRDGVDLGTTTLPRETLITGASGGIAPGNNGEQSRSWKWNPSNDDTPTVFTLLPNAYQTENSATPTPTYTTHSSITTTITSSIIATNVPQDALAPSESFRFGASILNVTENEVLRAQEMFGKLNASSTNTLMKVMKQADNNSTVRQLVLLLISHCNGPMNKTMEQEKEQLLDALLRLPVNEFTSEESRDIVSGINRLNLPVGRSRFILGPSATSTTERSVSTAPSVTTFRSRKGRRFKSTTETPKSASRRNDEIDTAETRNSLSPDDSSASDNRALELLRSLYSIAAKWG
ncbi:uncharacterized protein LOC105697880 [Orussus abietinus]|uniref:uncharacterized protein LOC105697880 n=1 Tax=Orussus abietinus TaxID=222816 RepID=UPI000C71601C|nr:uncharacterized protein LOC105697880 [Orussus abietinus]